jgi:hypothetical protein
MATQEALVLDREQMLTNACSCHPELLAELLERRRNPLTRDEASESLENAFLSSREFMHRLTPLLARA